MEDLVVFKENSVYYVERRTYEDMKIAICDDDKNLRGELKNLIYEYSSRKKYEFVVEQFESGEQLLNSKCEFAIIFMDYKMGGINGLETAKRLREQSINCTIVFLTSFPTVFVYSAFKVDTFRFIKKPIPVEEIYEALDDYFERFGNNFSLKLSVDGYIMCVKVEDITYVESAGKSCSVYVAGKGKTPCSNSMMDVWAKLPKRYFVKTHQSFIVNLNYVERFGKNSAVLYTGDIIEISRRKFKSFKEALIQFLDDESRGIK